MATKLFYGFCIPWGQDHRFFWAFIDQNGVIVEYGDNSDFEEAVYSIDWEARERQLRDVELLDNIPQNGKFQEIVRRCKDEISKNIYRIHKLIPS